jgi:glucose-6-phosphate 1-dehydrogenase
MMENHIPACSFVILGATGDLAARKLMPALFELHLMGALGPKTRIVGVSRQELSNEVFRERMEEALKEHSPKSFDEARWQELAPRLAFVQGNYDDPATYRALSGVLSRFDEEGAGGNRVFYLATPPSVFSAIVGGLQAAGLNGSKGWTRVVIEKPFGHDLKSAQRLNGLLNSAFDEEQVYRIDHYLGKETAQNIAVLRFANALFEPNWNSHYIDHVQITVAESMGIEDRASFYEEAGVLRDIIQNHVLQLATLVATEAPARYDARSVRDEKVKVLRAMRCARPEDTVKGQYAASGGMKGYLEEDGVHPRSRQGTYLAVEFSVENWRWAGVPFYVRSGKRLAKKASEIVLGFKTPPHVPFGQTVKPNALVLRLQPNEGISLRFNAKVPGGGLRIEQTSLDFTYDRGFSRANPDAYETLLLDVMRGDATLFMRADEIEAQWEMVAPLLDAWEEMTLLPYAAGSWGPKEADSFLAQAGRAWQLPG